MASDKRPLKYVMAIGVVLVCVVAIATGIRRNARRLPTDPRADVVKNFLRSQLDERYVDQALRGSPGGKRKMQEWSDQLKREYAGIYVPQYAAPAVAQDSRNQRQVNIEDLTIKEMLPVSVKANAGLRYAVASTLEVSNMLIRFPTKYFYGTVTLVERGEGTYVSDFQVDRFSDWAPGSPQGQDEQENLKSGAP